jgi:hypothetical protein
MIAGLKQAVTKMSGTHTVNGGPGLWLATASWKGIERWKWDWAKLKDLSIEFRRSGC